MAPADAPSTEACTGAADTGLAGGTKMEAMERAPAAGRISYKIHYFTPPAAALTRTRAWTPMRAMADRQILGVVRLPEKFQNLAGLPYIFAWRQKGIF